MPEFHYVLAICTQSLDNKRMILSCFCIPKNEKIAFNMQSLLYLVVGCILGPQIMCAQNRYTAAKLT